MIEDALRRLVRAEVEAAVAPLVAAIAAATAPRPTAAPLEPLAAILGCSPAAARMRENRDPSLRALALEAGRRRLYRRADVEALLAERARAGRGGRARLRAMPGRERDGHTDGHVDGHVDGAK